MFCGLLSLLPARFALFLQFVCLHLYSLCEETWLFLNSVFFTLYSFSFFCYSFSFFLSGFIGGAETEEGASPSRSVASRFGVGVPDVEGRRRISGGSGGAAIQRKGQKGERPLFGFVRAIVVEEPVYPHLLLASPAAAMKRDGGSSAANSTRYCGNCWCSFCNRMFLSLPMFCKKLLYKSTGNLPCRFG